MNNFQMHIWQQKLEALTAMAGEIKRKEGSHSDNYKRIVEQMIVVENQILDAGGNVSYLPFGKDDDLPPAA